jgi:branched-chain amino acid transport system permease protein
VSEASPNLIRTRGRELRPNAVLAFLWGLLPFAVSVGLALLLHFVIRPLMNDFIAKLALDMATNVILAVSLTMVNGFTGQFSIGHAAFMAVGGYTAAGIVYYGSYRLWGDANVHGGALDTLLMEKGLPFLAGGDLLFVVSLFAGAVAAAICGYLVGLPSLRLKGDYLAIVTLGFGEIVRVLIQSQTTDTLYDADEIAKTPTWQLGKYLGGPVGFSGLPSYTSLFWVGLFAFITLVVAFRLKESSYGRAFLSIREDEVAAEAMGIKTTKYKVRAFVIAAFFAGIAGGLYAHTLGVTLKADELAYQKSFDIIIMVVLGGMGSISGAAIAAGILTVLPELLRDPPSVFSTGALITVAVAAILAAVFASKKVRAVVWVVVAAAGWELVRRVAKWQGINLSDYRMILYALALILMMILRPEGLFGVRELWSIGGLRKFTPGKGVVV